MSKETLREILIIGIFATLFIPLIGLNNLAFPFVTGKVFTFRILIELLGGIWLLLAISDKKYRPRFSWLLVAVLVFVGVITTADIFGVDPHRSFWSDFERMDGLVNLFHLILYFFMVGTVLTTEKLWNYFFNFTIGVSTILSLLGLLQLAGGMTISTDAGRIDATIGNASFFATYILLHIFLAIFMLVRHSEKQKAKYIYGSIVLLQLIVLYFTATRSAMIGLIGGLFTIAILFAILKHNHRFLRKISISLIVGLVFIIGGFILAKDQPFVRNNSILNRYTVISADGFKQQPRYYMWSIAIQGFKERPILGWGQENFKFVFLKHYNPALYNSEIISDRAHNIVFDWLITGGLLGILSYLSLYGVALYYIWSSRRNNWSIIEKSVLTGFVMAYFTNGLFLFDNLTSYIIFFIFLGYIYSQTLPEYQEERVSNKLMKKHEQVEQNRIKMSTIPVVFVTLFLVYFINAKAIMAAANMSLATFFSTTKPAESLDKFKKALEYNSFSYEKIRQNLVLAAINVKKEESINNKIKQDYFTFALSEIEKQTREMPPDAHNFYLAGLLLYSYEKYDEALLFLEKARQLSPKKQVVLLRMVDAHIAKKDYEKARQTAKYTYELEPNYEASRITYASAAVYTGNNELASKILNERYSTDTLFDLTLLQAYAETKQYDKIIETYKKRLTEKPDDIQSKVSMAVAFAKKGDRKNAIKTFEEVVTQDSSFKEVGNFWISELRAGRIPR